MKKFYLIFLILLNSLIYAQITRDWVRQYNGSANMYDVPARIFVDDLNNIYVAGYSGVLQSASADYMLLKYTSDGDLLWYKNYDAGNYYDGIIDGLIDAQNNIYVTGESRLTSSNSDYCTIKFDSAGNIIWNMRYNGPPNKGDVPCKILMDNQNNLYVTGYSAQYYSPVQTTSDIVTIKYNNNGDSIWKTIFNNNGAYTHEDPSSICISETGSVYITGKGSSPFSSYDMITLKYSQNGSLIWVKRYNGSVNKDDYGVEVKTDSSGNVYVLGSTTTQLTENFDIILMKYNSNGDSVWAVKYNGTGNGRDFGHSILLESNGIYITGECGESNSQNRDIIFQKYNYEGQLLWTATFDGIAHMSDTPVKILKDQYGYFFVFGSSARGVLNWDFVVIRYDSNGNQVWFDTYNSQNNSDDNGIDLVFGSANDMYLTGTSLISGPNDIVTIKYSNVIGIKKINEKIPFAFTISQNYPNPFNPVTKIKFAVPAPAPLEKAGVRLVIYDALGCEVQTLVNEQLQSGTYEVDFDGSNFSSGVYYYTFSSGNYFETKRMVLIK